MSVVWGLAEDIRHDVVIGGAFLGILHELYTAIF